MSKYAVGVVVNNEDERDRLMNEHSKGGYFDLSFNKGIDRWYMETDSYPTVMNAFIEHKPMDILIGDKIQKIIDDGYKVIIAREGA